MYPHGARPALAPSTSRPRVVPIPVSLPVPLHVTSSRKVHRSADGIINIIQEISFYAEGGGKSLAGKQLKEVHSNPDAQVRGRFSAETNARVFVGERVVRMLIQTSIRPNSSDSLEIDEVFHFAESQEADVVPIAFEATLERAEGEHPAAEFDLSSPIIVALKQRILKDPGEQYKVLQAIELRANDSDMRPTQELARKSTLTQPSNDTAQFRERIFAGADVLRVDRDIIFVCDRPILSLSERREYMPEYPMAPRRRSASLTQSAPRVRHTPDKPRSRSQSRSWTDASTDQCHTAHEDVPTATSPYSLRETDSNSLIPPYAGVRTARDASPISSCPDSDRTSRSTRKKWTVNSVISKAGAATPERNDRARTARSLSTARNVSLSPLARSSDHRLPTARSSPTSNGEIPAIEAIPIAPNLALGPHGECALPGDDLVVAGPTDSLVRTCVDGARSPHRTRSASGCSTASQIPSCFSVDNNACQSPPFSSPRAMPGTAESSAPSTPLRTARSPAQRRAPSSAALDKRRGLFGYGTRPVTTPTRSARRSPSLAVNTGLEASPMHRATTVVLSPVQTAVAVKSSSRHSRHSQKESRKERRTVKPRVIPLDDGPPLPHSSLSSTNVATARNLFGTVATNESVARMFSADRTPDTRTARPLARSPYEPAQEPRTARENCFRSPAQARNTARNSPYGNNVTTAREARSRSPAQSLNTARDTTLKTLARSPYELKHEPLPAHEARSPAQALNTARSPYGNNVTTARENRSRSPAQALNTARNSPYGRGISPIRGSDCPGFVPTTRNDTTTAREARSPARALNTARNSPYGNNVTTARESRSPAQALNTARNSPYGKTARESSPIRGSDCPGFVPTTRNDTTTAREARSPAQALNTARNSSYGNNVTTAREARSPAQALNTAKNSPFGNNVTTARESRSPARSLHTGRQSPYDKSARSPALNTAVLSPYEQNVLTARAARSPAQSIKTARQSPYEKTARDASHASPARGLPTARGHADRSPANLKTAAARDRSPFDTTTAREARSPALNTARQSPYGNNVMTAREARTPAQSMKTARQSPYEKTARDASHASPARGLPTARGLADGSPVNLKTAAARDRSPYDTTTAREARSPALNTARQSPYGNNVMTAREARSPALNTARPSLYDNDLVNVRSPVTARGSAHSPVQRSLYLAPQMQQDNAAPPAGDDAYTTARAASPAPRGVASPLHPSMTARDQTAVSPNLPTAKAALNSTMSCISGGRDSDARWTARSAPRSPMMVTSPLRSACSRFDVKPRVMQQLPSVQQQQQLSCPSPQQQTAIYAGGLGEMPATSRTQSPATRSSASNLITAQGARSPHVDTDSEPRVVTARSPATLRTGRAVSRGVPASPANLRTARAARSSSVASQSPSGRQQQPRTAVSRTPEHNTMPDSHLRQEDSYSEQSQFTFQKTPSGYTQKPTHSSDLNTGLQRTPTKTENNNNTTTSQYYSARQTTPSRTLRPDEEDQGVRTVTKRTPQRVPECSLKSGCQATHAPRTIPAGPDSDGQDSPNRKNAAVPKTPERSLRTARGPAARTPSAPAADMRTPRTARPTQASPASSLKRSPAPSSHMQTAVSPDALSNSNNSNEDVATAQRRRPSPGPATARNWAAATEGPPTVAAPATEAPPTVAATAKPQVLVRANQADGKIHVEVCLSFKLNTTGTIRIRGEMVPALQPRAVSVNGQQIWSDRH